MLHCHVEGGLTLVLVVDIGSQLEQCLHHVRPVAFGAELEGRPPSLILNVEVGFLFKFDN
jgi:hypothetical protein